jgi:hypothetical protein
MTLKNIWFALKQTGHEPQPQHATAGNSVNCLLQDRDKRWALENAVMKLPVRKNAGISGLAEELVDPEDSAPWS